LPSTAFSAFSRASSKKIYILLSISSFAFITAILINAGFIESLYDLSSSMVYPSNPPTPHCIAVSSYSLAPFTSIVSMNAVDSILNSSGGAAVSTIYEVLAPVEIGSRILILRGISRGNLSAVAGSFSIYGEEFSDACMDCLWIGSGIAEELGLRINDTVILYSIMTSSPYLFKVKGIISSSSLLNWELLTNLDAARAVRGIGGSEASIALIFASNESSLGKIAEAFGISAEKSGILERALLALRYSGGNISASAYESLSSFYLSRLGISRSLLYAVLLSVLILLAIGFYYFGKAVAGSDPQVLSVLHEQGLSVERIKLYSLLLSSLSAAAGCLSSFAASYLIFPKLGVSFLGYIIHPALSSEFLALGFLFLLSFLSLGIYASEVVSFEET